MSADTDRLDARLSRLEGTVEQMDNRLADMNGRLDRLDNRMNNRFDALDGRISDLRTDFRRWMFLFFVAMTLVFTVVSVVVQLAL
jgi:predicted nuclease with TOPRIM domain